MKEGNLSSVLMSAVLECTWIPPLFGRSASALLLPCYCTVVLRIEVHNWNVET